MKKSSGFTIVETSLVLAIAGLIMVMAFFALPSLWSSQRDSDRRANVMGFISALKTYQTNNSRGALPVGEEKTYTLNASITPNEANITGGWYDFLANYYAKGSAIEDPSGSPYMVRIINECAKNINIGSTCQVELKGDENSDEFNDSINKEGYTPAFNQADPTLYVVKGGTCDEDKGTIIKTANNRSVAVVQVLERGKYCQNT